VSHGKNWNDGVAPGNDQLENLGALTLPVGPTGTAFPLKNIAAGETAFVERPSGFADDFADVVKWISPGILFSKMIEAGQ